ncbi:MAG: DUF302 domain-containing protein [Armatimonadota bacterium]
MAQFGMKTVVPGTMDSVKEQVVQALKAQGFGVLTEIDVRATLQAKIGKEIEPYLILGACNPVLAYASLETERDIGLLLPCNVVLRELDGEIEVGIIDPEAMFSVLDEKSKAQLAPNAMEAKARLQAVLASLK